MNNKGFTLIELLVVIGIISVLSAIVVPNFMGARERARDTQRKSDVRQIQKALELFKDNQTPVARYATVAEFTAITCAGQWPAAGTTIYMNTFPCDPSYPTTLRYTYTNPTSLTYTLYACLENKSDPQGATGSTCNWGGATTGIQYQIKEP